MTQSGFIAAIDLGTSKITGLIGRKNENNVISVLAHESLPSENSIRRGTVYNIDKAGAIVRKLILLLENKMNAKIDKVYVSLGGQSVHTAVVLERKTLPSSGVITESIIEQMSIAAGKYKFDMKSNYGVVDVEFSVDDKLEKSPVGIACSNLEAEFQIVVGRPNLSANIERVFHEKNKIKIADYIIGPIAAAEIALTNEEKELGCAFIDFGAGTTDLSIYKGGTIRYMVTIPFGGRNITKDIAELNFVETEAEQYKIKFGKAKENNESSMFVSPFSAKPDIDLVELNKVIVLRLDEIVANIREQIKLSGYHDQLGAGIIITGGASQLKNLDMYLNQAFNMPIRKAVSRKNLINNSPELSNDPAYTSSLGMLLMGNINCEKPVVELKETEEFEEITPKTSSWKGIFRDKEKSKKIKAPKEEVKENRKSQGFGQIRDLFTTMFDETEDND